MVCDTGNMLGMAILCSAASIICRDGLSADQIRAMGGVDLAQALRRLRARARERRVRKRLTQQRESVRDRHAEALRDARRLV